MQETEIFLKQQFIKAEYGIAWPEDGLSVRYETFIVNLQNIVLKVISEAGEASQ